MFKKILGILFLVSGVWGLVSSASAQTESITFTTYYPSPYGVYKNLRIYPNDDNTPGGSCVGKEGEMYFDRSDQALCICSGSPPTWVPIGGTGSSLWTNAGSNLYPKDSNWNVGIGTTTPAGKLHVQGPDDAASAVTFMPGLDTAAPGTPSLNVGIGTRTPIGGIGLHLKSDRWAYTSAAGMVIQAKNNGESPGVIFFNSADKDRGAVGVALGGGHWSSDATVGDTVLRSAQGDIIFATDVIDGPPYPAVPPPQYPARMIITNSGNVGIGTTNPQAKLVINNGNIYLTGNVGPLPLSGLHNVIHFGDPSEGWYIGRVNKGEALERIQITANGGTASLCIYKSGTTSVAITGAGDIQQWVSAGILRSAVQSDGTYWKSSDGRLKERIKNIDGDKAIEAISRLQPVEFDWRPDKNGDSAGHDIGFIAQEVAKVMPSAAKRNEDSGLWGVTSERLIPFIVSATQELIKENETLKKRIAALEAR
jgi:hypothetical protein